jgi:hypothetical protein
MILRDVDGEHSSDGQLTAGGWKSVPGDGPRPPAALDELQSALGHFLAKTES